MALINTKGLQKTWDDNINSPDLNPLEGVGTNATLMPAWRRNKLPEFYKGGKEMRVGNQPIDMSDPRILMSLASPGTLGPSLLPYAIGRQIDNTRQDRRLEAQYEPIAEKNARLSAQSSNYGGTQGGVGEASSQQAFEEILAQLVKAKRQVRQNQLAQEMQAVGALMALFGYGAGQKQPGNAGPESYGPSEMGE